MLALSLHDALFRLFAVFAMTNFPTSSDKNADHDPESPASVSSGDDASNADVPDADSVDVDSVDADSANGDSANGDSENGDSENGGSENSGSLPDAKEASTPSRSASPRDEARTPNPNVERVASSDDVANPPRPSSTSHTPSPTAPTDEPSGDGSEDNLSSEDRSDEDDALGDGPAADLENNGAGETGSGKNESGENGSGDDEEESPTISGPGVLTLKDMGESPPRDTCANCQAPLVGPYCSQCGQRAADRVVPLHEMTQEWVEDLFEFDIRIFRTLPTFFFKPGRLTKEYVQGRRVRYVRPLRLYLVASFILFTVLAFSDVATIDGLDDSDDASAIADSIAASGSEGAAPESPEADTLSAAIASAKQRASSSSRVDPETLRRELQTLGPLRSADPATIDSIVNAQVGTATETFTNSLAQRRENNRSSGADTSSASTPSADTSGDSDAQGENDSFTNLQQRRKVAEEVKQDMSFKLTFIQDETERRQAEEFVRNQVAQSIIDPNSFIRGMIDRAPYVMFLLLPLFAFLLKLLYIRRRKLYIQHLIFALHIHAFIFLTFALATGMLVSDIPSLQTIGGWLTLAPFVYVYIAMQHVYEQGWIKTGIKMMVLFTLYNTVLTFGILILAIANLLLM